MFESKLDLGKLVLLIWVGLTGIQAQSATSVSPSVSEAPAAIIATPVAAPEQEYLLAKARDGVTFLLERDVRPTALGKPLPSRYRAFRGTSRDLMEQEIVDGIVYDGEWLVLTLGSGDTLIVKPDEHKVDLVTEAAMDKVQRRLSEADPAYAREHAFIVILGHSVPLKISRPSRTELFRQHYPTRLPWRPTPPAKPCEAKLG